MNLVYEILRTVKIVIRIVIIKVSLDVETI